MSDDADEAKIEVANIDIKRILRLLYRVNVLVDVLVLDIEFPQLLDVVELEGKDWLESDIERVWQVSLRTSVWEANGCCSNVWM